MLSAVRPAQRDIGFCSRKQEITTWLLDRDGGGGASELQSSKLSIDTSSRSKKSVMENRPQLYIPVHEEGLQAKTSQAVCECFK